MAAILEAWLDEMDAEGVEVTVEVMEQFISEKEGK